MSLSLPEKGMKKSEPKYTTPRSVGHSIYKALGHGLLNQFNQSGTSGLGTPTGIIGSIYQNLFGQNPTEDWLGARGALQDSLSGAGLGTSIGIARNQLLPSTMQNIQEGSSALRTQAGASGLRFSTDLAGAQGRLANDQFNNLESNSLGAGLNIFNQRAQTSKSIFDLIANMGQQNNPFQQLMQFLGMGGAPQLANFGGGGGGGGGGVSYSGPYGGKSPSPPTNPAPTGEGG